MSFNTLRSIFKVAKQFSCSSCLLKHSGFLSQSSLCFFITLPSEEWAQYQFLLSNLCICLVWYTGCSFSATSLVCLETGHQQMAEREFCQWLSDILLRITHFSAAGSCDNQVLLPAVPGVLLRTTDFGATENGVHGLEFSPILTFLELLKATNNLLTFALSAL